MGSAMWMYDLTGGARIGKLHKRLKKPTRRSRTCRRCPRIAWPARYLYYDARADDARLTLTHRPHRGARLRRGDRQRLHASSASRKDGDGPRRAARRVEADGQRFDVQATAVVNAAGVWADDVRALDEGAHPDSHPSRQGHPHHGAVVEGAQRHRGRRPRAEGQALGVRRAVGRTDDVHLHRHDRHRLRRPARRSAVHRRRRRVPAAGHQRLGHHRR